MAKIFDANFDIHADGEFFYHATTKNNVFKMINSCDEGLKARGNGQLGQGFYVTGARSDYLKAMARRIRVDKEDVPLFLFYVRVKGFYRLTPNFLIRWDTSAPENPAADFSAVIWYKEGLGGVGNVERGGLIPPLATNQLESVYFKYGEYRQELMFGTEIAGETDANRLGFVKALWELASTKNYPKFEDVKHFGKIATLLPILGARKILTHLFLELAFRSPSSLENSSIVGVKVFSPTIEPVALKFTHDNKPYDLKPAVIDESTLKADDDPMNFHDEVWLDLDKMIEILSAVG